MFIVEGDKSIIGEPSYWKEVGESDLFFPCLGEQGICVVSHSYFKVQHYSVALAGIIQLPLTMYVSGCGWTARHSGTHLLFTTSSKLKKNIREDKFTYFPTLIIPQSCNETLSNDFNSGAFVLDSNSSMAMRKFKKLVYLLHLIFCERALC